MTKQEILEKRRSLFGNKHMELFSDTIQMCMDEFAKEQCISFLIWLSELSDYRLIDNNWYHKDDEEGEDPLSASFIQYQFIEHQQTINK